jgi:hypothetical protein
MSRFNVNTTYPLIPNAQEYTYFQKFITICSNDRDMIKYPNSSEFEIELPQDYLNVLAATIQYPNFPYTPVFSIRNNNIQFTFKITDPYNPIINNVINPLQIEIYYGLKNNVENNYIVTIEEGIYTENQMATELTNKMNEAVTKYLKEYLKETNSSNINSFTYYNEFRVAFNEVGNDLFFGNSSSNFIITNNNSDLYGSNLQNTMNQCYNFSLPSFKYWGLPAYLGFTRCDEKAKSLPVGELPRFYYTKGQDGYWIPQNTLLTNSQVFFLKCPYKLDILGENFYYIDIQELNCIDNLSPYNVSNYTLTTNGNNSRVNSSFARTRAGTAQVSLAQIYNTEYPYKLFIPPAERIRRLHIAIRNHNGQLIDFGNKEFSFMLVFSLYSAQIARKSNVFQPNINH